MLKKVAFTIVELLVVVIVIGVLASMAVPNFSRMKERAVEKQARTMVKQILSREKNYRYTNASSSYLGCTGTAQCADRLNMDLNDGNWDYSFVIASPMSSSYARARRVATSGLTKEFRTLQTGGMRCYGADCLGCSGSTCHD